MKKYLDINLTFDNLTIDSKVGVKSNIDYSCSRIYMTVGLINIFEFFEEKEPEAFAAAIDIFLQRKGF